MIKNKETRIGIIGAGASGLTAAETLIELGYVNIVILEKNPKAGGKCFAYEFEGRKFELGAGLIAENNKIVFNLALKYNIPLSRVVSKTSNLFDLESGEKIHDIFELPEQISFLWQLLMKYRRLCHRYESITKPGYQLDDLLLCQNFNDWAQEHKIPLILENFERFFTGFGYGYWEEIPAAHVLKYVDWETVKSFIRGKFYTFPESIQSLWIAVAAAHNVRYNQEVIKIHRGDVIRVETTMESYEFDYLLVSSPLDDFINYLEPSKEEQILFSQILYNDYQCYAYSLENFPNETGFLPKNFNPERRNQVLFWYKPFKDSNFYTFYVLGDWKTSEEEVRNNIEQLIHKFGGSVTQFHTAVRWKYFPRFSPENLSKGFYNRLEKIQGINNTFYIGELPSFSTVELSAAYAKQLITSNFEA